MRQLRRYQRPVAALKSDIEHPLRKAAKTQTEVQEVQDSYALLFGDGPIRDAGSPNVPAFAKGHSVSPYVTIALYKCWAKDRPFQYSTCAARGVCASGSI